MKPKINYALLVLYVLLLATACKTPIKIYEDSGHKIDLERTNHLYKNYNTKIKPSVEDKQKELVPRDNYNGTEYVLVSIQQMENYIKFLKQVEKINKSNPNNKITGIAIFLGANNEDEQLVDKPRFNSNIRSYDKMNEPNDRLTGDIRGRMTVFFAPTYRDTVGDYDNEFERHKPFYIMPNNPDNNIYKGQYADLVEFLRLGLINSGSRSTNTNTSLNADEFNSMPPKI